MLAAILALAFDVSGWSQSTLDYFCRESVDDAFGLGVYQECFGNASLSWMLRYCSWHPTEFQTRCVLMGEASPAVVTQYLVDDAGRRSNYEDCSIHASQNEKKYFCGDGVNHAWINGEKWLAKAYTADSRCERAYLFCIASSYFADSYDPLNMVMHESPECRKRLHDSIEKNLESGRSGWLSSIQCDYSVRTGLSGMREVTHHQLVRVSPYTINRILENLSSTAGKLNLSVSPETEIVEGVLSECVYPEGEAMCGKCVCLQTEGGCGRINLADADVEVSSLLGSKVEIETEKEFHSTVICPQSYSLKSVKQLEAETTSSTTSVKAPPPTSSSSTSTTLAAPGFIDVFKPLMLLLFMGILFFAAVLLYVREGGYWRIKKRL